MEKWNGGSQLQNAIAHAIEIRNGILWRPLPAHSRLSKYFDRNCALRRRNISALAYSALAGVHISNNRTEALVWNKCGPRLRYISHIALRRPCDGHRIKLTGRNGKHYFSDGANTALLNIMSIIDLYQANLSKAEMTHYSQRGGIFAREW